MKATVLLDTVDIEEDGHHDRHDGDTCAHNKSKEHDDKPKTGMTSKTVSSTVDNNNSCPKKTVEEENSLNIMAGNRNSNSTKMAGGNSPSTDTKVKVEQGDLDSLISGVKACDIGTECQDLSGALGKLSLGGQETSKDVFVGPRRQPQEDDERGEEGPPGRETEEEEEEGSGEKSKEERTKTTDKGQEEYRQPLMKLKAPDCIPFKSSVAQTETARKEGEDDLVERGPMLGVPSSTFQPHLGNDAYLQDQAMLHLPMPPNFPCYGPAPTMQGMPSSVPMRGKRTMESEEMYYEPPKFTRPQDADVLAAKNLNNLDTPNFAVTKKVSSVYHKQMSGGTVYAPSEASADPLDNIEFPDSCWNIPPEVEPNTFDEIIDFLTDGSPEVPPSAAHAPPTSHYNPQQQRNGIPAAPPVLPNQLCQPPPAGFQYNQMEQAKVDYQDNLSEMSHRAVYEYDLGVTSSALEDVGYGSDLSPSQHSQVGSPEPVASPIQASGMSPQRNNFSPPLSNMSQDSGLCSPMSEHGLHAPVQGEHSDFIDKNLLELNDALEIASKDLMEQQRLAVIQRAQQDVRSPPHHMVQSPGKVMVQSPGKVMVQSPGKVMVQSPGKVMVQSPGRGVPSPPQAMAYSPGKVVAQSPGQGSRSSAQSFVPSPGNKVMSRSPPQGMPQGANSPAQAFVPSPGNVFAQSPAQGSRSPAQGFVPSPGKVVVQSQAQGMPQGSRSPAQAAAVQSSGMRMPQNQVNGQVVGGPAPVLYRPQQMQPAGQSAPVLGTPRPQQFAVTPSVGQAVQGQCPAGVQGVVVVPPTSIPATVAAAMGSSPKTEVSPPVRVTKAGGGGGGGGRPLQVNKEGKIALPPMHRPKVNNCMVPVVVSVIVPPNNSTRQTTRFAPIAPREPGKEVAKAAAPSNNNNNNNNNNRRPAEEVQNRGPARPPQNDAKKLSKPMTRLLTIARRLVADMKRENLTYVDNEGDTYLHVAVCCSDRFMVQALLERLGRENLSDIQNKQNAMGQTALYLAVSTNHPEMVQLLVSNGADVNHQAMSQRPSGEMEQAGAIHSAASGGQSNLATLRALLQAPNISMDALNSDGHTALQCAILCHGRPSTENSSINSSPIVQTLIQHGAQVNTQVQKNGKTALMYALESHDLDLIESTFQAVEPSLIPGYLRTQAFDSNSCLKIAENLKHKLSSPADQQRLMACLKPSISHSGHHHHPRGHPSPPQHPPAPQQHPPQ